MEIRDVFADLPTLETPRLRLRRLTMDDAVAVFEYARDEEVARYVTWPAHQSIEDARRFLELVTGQLERGEVAPWGMELRTEHRLIGSTGYIWWQPAHARAELGWAMARPYWNQGLMTEAVKACIAFGFARMGLNRIEARCRLENGASERVMQKAGMTFEGIARQMMLMKGNYVDLKVYSILREEHLGQAD